MHDCHAEVLARRGFIGYLLASNSELFEGSRKLPEHLRVLLYISQAPCGDASLPFLESSNPIDETRKVKSPFVSLQFPESSNPIEETGKVKTSLPLHFRGPMPDPAIKGILRRKPGRADALLTDSQSCSDKIALWNVVGVQGALLAHLIDPIYLDAIFVRDRFHRESLERALWGRFSDEIDKLSPPYHLNRPLIVQVPSLQAIPVRMVDSTAHVAWLEGDWKKESLVEGRKAGSAAPKKDSQGNVQFSPKSISSLSQRLIFAKWQEVFRKVSSKDSSESIVLAKLSSSAYQQAKDVLLNSGPFQDWKVSDEKMRIRCSLKRIKLTD